jgi:hypothetical protein
MSTDLANLAYVIQGVCIQVFATVYRSTVLSVHCPSTVPFDCLDVSLQTVRDVKRLAFWASKRAVGQVDAHRTAYNSGLGYAMFVHHKDRSKTRVTDEHAAFFI